MPRLPHDLCHRTIGLTKMFGAIRGIEALDLRVEPGEIFGFLGPNGAGKTTTIRVLLDLQRPTAGTALVLGLDAHRDGVAIHSRVGYLRASRACVPLTFSSRGGNPTE